MPRIRYRVAVSLDGYIAGPRGEFDWIPRDPEIDFASLFGQFDTFLIGRRTFEIMTKPGSPPLPPGSKAFVFSRTLRAADHPGVSLSAEVSCKTIAAIRAQASKDIWLFGGGELFRSFLNQGFVDTIEVAIMPVLLGEGLPMLAHPAKGSRLRLTEHKVYASGIVLLEYAIAPLSA